MLLCVWVHKVPLKAGNASTENVMATGMVGQVAWDECQSKTMQHK